jgi:hypothetical protein
MTKEESAIIPSSFRDRSGFLFKSNEKLYRIVNKSYQKHFEFFVNSGLYKKLTEENLLVKHNEVLIETPFVNSQTYKIIEPEFIEFISYPYEWSFSQLKDAALLTIKIQKIALNYGMQLKDASAYNIQFHNGKPIFIDTLSFEIYEQGKPWVAYRQFCQHFLAPLALMVYSDIDLNKLLRVYIDGIPLPLASKLLPFKTHFKPLIQLHLHLHAKAQKKHANNTKINQTKRKFSTRGFRGLIDHFETGIKKWSWLPAGTEWAEYYQDDSYTDIAFENKKKIVFNFLQKVMPKTVWDLGGNDGTFSELATKVDASTITFDIDPASVEKNYLRISEDNETKILPLLLDLTNPSPAIGFNNTERESLIERGPADLAMALALVHHLAISNNVPLENLAHFFSQLCKNLIVEFIPKSDKKVKKLLATREDIFVNYNEEHFQKSFAKYFVIKEKIVIKDSTRVLYLMNK